jgi:hypothetical protein
LIARYLDAIEDTSVPDVLSVFTFTPTIEIIGGTIRSSSTDLMPLTPNATSMSVFTPGISLSEYR